MRHLSAKNLFNFLKLGLKTRSFIPLYGSTTRTSSSDSFVEEQTQEQTREHEREHGAHKTHDTGYPTGDQNLRSPAHEHRSAQPLRQKNWLEASRLDDKITDGL